MQSDQLTHKTIRVGLLGAGTVGSQTARLIVEQRDELAARTGAVVELVGVACLRPEEVDAPWIARDLLTTDTAALCAREDVDIVIELIGGLEPAHTFVKTALEHGKSVVTANKALLAKFGPELYKCAESHGVDLYFEAAVAGAIPILRPLRESLIGDEITQIFGIVNGTTNYILDEMTVRGLDFDTALHAAQEKGYAEADPTGDVEGFDAANKAAILATLAFQMPVSIDDVSVEGITAITAADIAAASAEKRVIKLLAAVERHDENGVSVSVYPALVGAEHPLASVHGSFNAVFVKAQAADDLMFYGRGAGGAPTASAVVGDVVSAARNLVCGGSGFGVPMYNKYVPASDEQARADFVVRCNMEDTSLALCEEVMDVFASHGVQVERLSSSCEAQYEGDGDCPACGIGGQGDMRMLAKACSEADLHEVIADLQKLDVVCGKPLVLRVIK
ncbi:homoserine dehydrogenase [Gardnerella vaginalis]|uniref:homoserine dehydrogenase n=1 Tax=Gardnerella vaginalis TaxID=2702 RepID=UPI000352C83C|nr:homoserine dehydrogenase [Gardnerella vaginalis]EPI43577.1 homoserine dehydrogenase [Gardnerella vaginalis JCP8481A]EPI43743.1 homoserine dehydrogenase [Gardnerella vaginalis JCP8481B]